MILRPANARLMKRKVRSLHGDDGGDGEDGLWAGSELGVDSDWDSLSVDDEELAVLTRQQIEWPGEGKR